MRHDDIWRALDSLAAENGLSASGLAKRAGLDPTAFNPSKRVGPDGRARWSLRLLADRMVELDEVDALSYQTVRRVLKRYFLDVTQRKPVILPVVMEV